MTCIVDASHSHDILHSITSAQCRKRRTAATIGLEESLGKTLGVSRILMLRVGLRTRRKGRPEQRGPYEGVLIRRSIAIAAGSFALAGTVASAMRIQKAF